MANQDYNFSGIAGSDGVAPIWRPLDRWTTWALHEIFNGGPGTGRYVPKLKDHVRDLDSMLLYQVVEIDITTAIAVLKEIKDVPTGVLDDIDILMGAGPGAQTPPSSYRVYADRTVNPNTLAVNSQLRVYGTEVMTMKLFRGKMVNGDFECVSGFYDQTGNLLTQAIPLKLVAFEGNLAVKAPPLFHTTSKLEDGELMIARFYSAGGHVMSTQQLLAENTGFQRVADASVKYVASIELETPFLSVADPTLIQYPINVFPEGMNMMGVVTYSDGSSRRLPVDGTKFTVRGLRSYAASVVGQKLPVVLQYNLSADEVAFNTGEGPFITKRYMAQTMKVDGNYTSKLYGYPVWVDHATGYRMEWFMYNLDRRVAFRVTPHVRFNENTGLFDPLAYGVKQRVSVSIKLSDVSASLTDYIHVQAIEISLLAPGDEHTATNWLIGFDPNQEPPFGRNNQAKLTVINQNLYKVNISCGETDYSKWLDRVFRRTRPLFDDQSEIESPNPTHIALVFAGREVQFPIEQWIGDLTVSDPLPADGTLFIKFIKRLADSDLQLAVAGLPIQQLG